MIHNELYGCVHPLKVYYYKAYMEKFREIVFGPVDSPYTEYMYIPCGRCSVCKKRLLKKYEV